MEGMEHLLEQARQGEARALSTLYNRFVSGIFGYIAMRVSDRTTAEDLTSEVFLQMIEGIHNLKARDEAGFAAWLLRIARIAVAGHYRKRARQPALVSLPGESWEENQTVSPLASSDISPGDPASWMETREEWETVVAAINTLTEEQRQVLVGRLIMGYDVATVARMIGKKENAVKALQFRALKSLQRLLGNETDLTYSLPERKEKIQ
jgi:RNA polymerase sigma-70 factor (ECF subfamily)